MRLFTCALVALSVALLHAAPQNGVVVESDQTAVSIARENDKQKGDSGDLFSNFQNDAAMVRTCNGMSCEFMTVAEAKQLERIETVEAVKGETELTKAITPTFATMSESLRSLQAQKQLLENLEASMAALRSRSIKGEQLAQAANNQFSASMTKGISFSAESKGQYAPAIPAKGPVALPPSKGASYSYASSMNTEAMLCPMTMFELGKCQKLSGEMKIRMDASNAMSARLMSEKQRLENQLAVSEMLRKKAEDQAAFNAKYAAEQKAEADTLRVGLNQCTTEKAIVTQQKQNVEAQLVATTSDLVDERQKNAELTANLSTCNENNAALTTALGEQTARAEAAEQDLADTKAKLEEEIDKAIGLEESLRFSQNRVSRCESDLRQQRTAREETEEELVKTMTELASCENEAKVAKEMLSRTREELQRTTTALARETAAREMLQEELDSTVEQLRNTEQQLRDMTSALVSEQNAHATTKRNLEETQEELNAARLTIQSLEEARQQLEAELVQTKAQLETMTAERDELQTSLEATTALLADCTANKMKCESDLTAQMDLSNQLNQQLTKAVTLLQAEKKAREELTATIILVEETSLKVQEEVKTLQVENIGLQQQVEKLQAEQNVALALAAGCPPTYEKFGTSCYKYVREKTQWKMAQEQCMKDSGNLVAIESTQEQIFVTNYLKRHDASDAYTYTSGNKQYNGWKWLGAANNHLGANGVDFWYDLVTQRKSGSDCQAMYMYDQSLYGKWVALPCHSSAPYVCEYQLLPYGQAAPNNAAEQMAILKMAEDAPPYLSSLARQ